MQLRIGGDAGFNVLAAIDTTDPLAEMKVRAVAHRVVGPLPSRADDNAHVDFPRFTEQVASHYSAAVLDTLLAQLPA